MLLKSRPTAKRRETVNRRVNARHEGVGQPAGGFTAQLKLYYLHHWHTVLESWQRLWLTPTASILTWLLVGIALALPSALYIALNNMEQLHAGWQGSVQITAYLEDSFTAGHGRKLSVNLKQHELVKSARYVSREEALADFSELSGMAEITASLQNNPLPASIILVLDEGVDDLPQLSQELQIEVTAMDGVEDVILDQQWLQRLYQIMRLGQRFTVAVSLLLGIAVVVVVGNTIRLSIESRREEIIVVKLVGGTDSYVQRPFLYYGLLFGLGGGVACLIILTGLYAWLSPIFGQLVQSYGSAFVLQGLGVLDAILLLLLASLLGVLGAWFVVGRHLRHINPK